MLRGGRPQSVPGSVEGRGDEDKIGERARGPGGQECRLNSLPLVADSLINITDWLDSSHLVSQE